MDLIKAIASHPLLLAIGSGATQRDIELMLTALKIREHFPIIVAADDVTKSKPDPETYLKCFARLQETDPTLQKSECIVIEDTSGGHAFSVAYGATRKGPSALLINPPHPQGLCLSGRGVGERV